MPDDERIERLELEVEVLRANNKGLKDKIEELKDKNKSIVYNYEMVVDKLENSTPNDKIKAKIEELENDKNRNKTIFVQAILYSIEVLQSLLEKE